jgi:hypothetical protein
MAKFCFVCFVLTLVKFITQNEEIYELLTPRRSNIFFKSFENTHKTSGFKTSGFKMYGFKTSGFKTSGLQNVRLSKRQVSKRLVSKRPVFKFDILIKQKV